jgi:hypothetical protein
MPEQPPREPEWFKKFKEVNTKASDASPRSSPTRVPGHDGEAERRRHHRFDLNDTSLTLYRDGLLTILGMSKKENKGKVAVNLSEGGLQVIMRERLTLGAKVKIRLEIAKFKDAIEAAGVVRWCYQNSQRKDDFHAGIQFEDLPGTESRKIASMREWFTSPAFRAVRETRGRKKEDDGMVFPK